MLGQGHILRLLDEAQELGHYQHPGPENQDSQHMIAQPRGSFPEKGYLAKGFLQKLLAMLFFYGLVVRRGSMRVWQGDAWFKTLVAVTVIDGQQAAKILNCRIGTR